MVGGESRETPASTLASTAACILPRVHHLLLEVQGLRGSGYQVREATVNMVRI